MTSLDAAITSVISASSLTYLTEGELDSIITMVDGLKVNICKANVGYIGQMVISQTNTFWSRLCGSLSVNGLQAKMLHILSVIAYDSSNTPMILGCLNAIGEQLDGYLNKLSASLDDKDNAEWGTFRDVLRIFYISMDFDLSAAQVLDFVDKKPHLAVGVLDATLASLKQPIAGSIVFSNWQSDAALAVAVSKNLYQLSLHSTYFEGTSADTAGTAASSHHHEFQKFVGEVVTGIVSSNVMHNAVWLLTDWLEYLKQTNLATTPQAVELMPWMEVFMSNMLAFIANVISKTDDTAVALRNHVAAETTLVPSVVIPYINFALGLLEANVTQNLGRSVRTILLLLKLLSFMTHKVKIFRPAVKAHPELVQRILTQPLLWSSPYQIEFIALCTRLCVNAELEDGTRFLEHVNATSLNADMRGKLAWRLTGAADEMYPTNTLSAMYSRLEAFFDESIAVQDTSAVVATGGQYAVHDGVKGDVAY